MNKKGMLTTAVFAVAAVWGAAQAQTAAGARALTIVVPYPAGGTADLLPRLLAPKVQAILGEPVIVLNKPGAAGNIGADYVAQSPSDGKTLLVVPPHFFVADMLYKLKFSPREFVPISIMASYPNVLLVGAKHDALDLKGFIEYAKTSKAPPTAGSPGTGTSQHLTAEMLRLMANFDYSHIPYKGSSQVLTDLVGGQLDFAFDNLLAAQPMIKAGRLKLLGVGSATRNKLYPDVPAIQELVPGFESITWMGIAAAPGTPDAIAERLSRAFQQAARSPEISRQIEDMQAEVVGSSSADMAAIVRQNIELWSKVIKTANVTLE
ncbi:Tripartite tricarboxylate transporter family receptor [Pigmentiphaga humi]|uniref:Tripartite tricarboxylate transporter family receptor n=1 Tax=Pigmentiphaga humi TaxID=2478468 RepID=A0A3P4B797_9BURK|nr:tripartite tricarboxylate transporter substrate binding protein [Pigmentiphaga humi]VCU71045.1 Tripartite tricarboxylate transporter family receptor [Pigmentiphaga humi]